MLSHVVQEHGVVDRSPVPPSWSKVLDLLEDGDYDWLHVSAHGNFSAPGPNADSAIWLQDNRPLRPDDLIGPRIEGHIRRTRPAFVLNACHGGRLMWALTGLGGWASRLISMGASLFLAPLWTVDDARALDFARTLYRELFAGRTVADSVLNARLATRREGDPTWLAYSLYCHPNARIVLQPESMPES
jgi:CHAT domain-containing protein